MPGLTSTKRTSTEVAGWRAEALAQLDDWGPNSSYVRQTRPVVVEVLDWLLGVRGEAPWTGRAVLAGAETVRDELLEAVSAAELAVGAEQGRRSGRVAQVLSWYLGDPDVPSPL